ncbi:helix-turn-helix transcriptional regulator [Streptomyces sp. NBC_01352]|uniref:Helix-turn-helix domain-containing protein n=1 Tax=Streptomyces plumbiresistens TaxID=511811 RepID=A0ABP7SHV4_9ACTN|nr:helix-turn-helix domain-containing protein [Streptomyces sp. NBC_01352]
MKGERFARMHCSVARAAAVVADQWTVVILRDLFLGLNRYEDLRADLGIATNVLADRLDHLVAEGVVERVAYQERPVRYTYELTDAGRELYGTVLTLLTWGDRHRAVAGPPLVLVHETCGHAAQARVTCSHCGDELRPGEVRHTPGPGGRTEPGTALVHTVLDGAGLHGAGQLGRLHGEGQLGQP